MIKKETTTRLHDDIKNDYEEKSKVDKNFGVQKYTDAYIFRLLAVKYYKSWRTIEKIVYNRIQIMRLSFKDKAEKQKKVIELSKLGFTNKEISKITNVTEKTIGIWLKNKNLMSSKIDESSIEVLKELFSELVNNLCSIEINKISIEISIDKNNKKSYSIKKAD